MTDRRKVTSQYRIMLRGVFHCEANIFGDFKDSDAGTKKLLRGKIQIGKDKKSARLSNGTNRCRETQCNDFSTIFRGIFLANRKIYLNDPEGKKKPLSVLKFRVSRKRDASGPNGRRVLASNVNRFLVDNKDHSDLYAFLDVLMAPFAMLIAGPSGFQPGKNKTTRKGKSGNSVKNVWINYGSISNIWLKHPALLSFFLGLLRAGVEIYCEGRDLIVDRKLSIKETRSRLASISNKESLSSADRRYLLEVARTTRKLFYTRKTDAYLSRYPINRRTWVMVYKLIREDLGKNIAKNWQEHDNLYGSVHYGFLTWCKRHPKKPKNFSLTQGKKASLRGIYDV